MYLPLRGGLKGIKQENVVRACHHFDVRLFQKNSQVKITTNFFRDTRRETYALVEVIKN